MKHKPYPALLVLTSSFPNSPVDETCGYIRDFARSLSTEFNVTVLAPPDHNATDWPVDLFELQRSRSVLPPALDPFQAGNDLNSLAEAGLFTRLAALLSLACLFWHALWLAFKADAICSHWMLPSGFIGALICRLLKKPHIVVEHSGAYHLLARIRGGKTIARFVINSSNQIVAVSADLRTKLIDLFPQARDVIDVIPMGANVSRLPVQINKRRKEPAPESPLTILFIGRLTKIKGLDVLLRAASGLANLRLVIGGDGECRRELEQLAHELSINADFLGRINASRRKRLFSMCDIVVIPSRILPDGRTEGTPVVCLEAMAAGRVIIAARVGGLAEVIVDQENGLLFEYEDHQDLREKIRMVLEDKRLCQSIEREAIRRADDYGWERTGLRYAQAINRALKNDVLGNRRIEVSNVNR